MRHKHRVLPGHMGGEYVEGNVIVLSVTQHAMWHFANWKLYQKWEDNVAWRALAGLINSEEAASEAIKNGAKAKWWTNGEQDIKSHICPVGWRSGRSDSFKKAVSLRRTGSKCSEKVKQEMSKRRKGKAKSQEHKDNIKKTHNTPEMIALHTEQARKLNSQKWVCLVTGKISTAGPLTIYQRANGIDTAKRVKLIKGL